MANTTILEKLLTITLSDEEQANLHILLHEHYATLAVLYCCPTTYAVCMTGQCTALMSSCFSLLPRMGNHLLG